MICDSYERNEFAIKISRLIWAGHVKVTASERENRLCEPRKCARIRYADKFNRSTKGKLSEHSNFRCERRSLARALLARNASLKSTHIRATMRFVHAFEMGEVQHCDFVSDRSLFARTPYIMMCLYWLQWKYSAASVYPLQNEKKRK